MNFNFSILEMGFKAYLENIQRESGNDETIDLSGISIFAYSEEFKDYVSKELNLTSSEIPSDFSELLNMEIVNGELVPREDFDDEDINSLSDEQKGVIGVVNNLLKDENVQNILDIDKSGNLDNQEVGNFLEFLSLQDNNVDTLSINDIVLGMDKLKDSTFSFSDFVTKDLPVDTDIQTPTTVETPADVPSSGGSSSSGGGGSYSGSSFSSTDTTNTQKTEESKYKTMELTDLQNEQATQKQNIKSASSDVNSVYNGTNEKVKTVEDFLKTSEEAYTKAVQEDEQLSDELKNEQQTNLQELNLEEDNNDSLRANIDSLDSAISLKNGEITSMKSNISALEASYSKLVSQTSDDAETQAAIDMQEGLVYTKINAAKNDLAKLEEELEKLNESKKENEEKLKTSDENLSKLQTERSDIETRISNSASTETQSLLSTFQTAKTDAENVKKAELKTAKDNLAVQQKTLDEINSYIDIKKAQEIKKENKVSSGELFDSDSKYVTSYVNDGEHMPYLLIAPENADPNEELPVLVYMHGSGEVGGGEKSMLSVGPGKFMPNWDLENFNGYVICPVLTGKYNAGSWNNKKAEGYIRDILTDFESTYAVDKDKMAVAGHSLGGMGALYMAKHMEDVFSSAAVLSGYDVGINTSDINIPIIGYVGTSESQGPMNQLFKNTLGEEYLIHVQANHGGAPKEVLNRDIDGNGRSDFFEFLFGDKDLEDMK